MTLSYHKAWLSKDRRESAKEVESNPHRGVLQGQYYLDGPAE